MTSIRSFTVRSSESVVDRLRLEDDLRGRPDIVAPSSVTGELRIRLSNALVAGVDYAGGSLAGELPAGGRYVELCFSSGVSESASHSIEPYKFPIKSHHLREYYADTLGMDASGWAALYNVFRIDFTLIDRVRELVRASPAAWRLLLSHEFSLAVAHCDVLKKQLPDAGWRSAAVNAFKLLAELERLVLLVRRLARMNQAIDLGWLSLALRQPGPLRFPPGCDRAEYHSFMERLLLCDISIETFLGQSARRTRALTAEFPLRQLAAGVLPTYDIAVFDNLFIRDYLVDAIRNLGKVSRGRPSHLTRPVPGLYWGICPAYLVGVAINDMLDTYGEATRSRLSDGPDSRQRRIDLVRHLLRHADPAAAAAVDGRGKADTAEWVNNWRRSAELAGTYLPNAGKWGAAARFDPNLWNDREHDLPSWRIVQDPAAITKLALPRLTTSLHHELKKVQKQFRKLFSVSDSDSDNAMAARTVCALATSESLLTNGRSSALALARLLKDKPLQNLLGRLLPSKQFGKKVLARVPAAKSVVPCPMTRSSP